MQQALEKAYQAADRANASTEDVRHSKEGEWTGTSQNPGVWLAVAIAGQVAPYTLSSHNGNLMMCKVIRR